MTSETYCPYVHPYRCSEVEKKGDTSARLSVEEAMTQARLRYMRVHHNRVVIYCMRCEA